MWVGKRANKSSKNELVLTKPCDVGKIGSGGVILAAIFRKALVAIRIPQESGDSILSLG
ncbi:hypothetical protein PanWU01x14_235510 [Parasponia andersonii]|uniref:Uncharacterized protein n=1 Tax=Parasponia andersonii TaxID=3476 RepID=A0A2P5BIQ2_PARAD|nr:hypothetical protein PanWU01x14_235510 [Parasponia andersonii]